MIYTIGESGMTHISFCFPDFVHMLGLGAWRQHGDPLTTFKTLKHYVLEIIQKTMFSASAVNSGPWISSRNHNIYIYGGVSFVAWHAGVPHPGDFLDKIPGRAEQVRPPSGAIG